MSILIRSFINKSKSTLNRIFISRPRTRASFSSSSSTIMATLNSHQNNIKSNLKANGNGAENTAFNSHEQSGCKSTPVENYNYESAVLKLHSLVSNAEVLASLRANAREHRHMTHIHNINKFILRSGITEEEIDRMSIIHVSGTKGKGSTCAFCECILHSKGYKTGLFTSPHLVEVRERIRINGRPVSKEVYAHHFWKVYNRLIATQEDKDEKLPAYFAFNMILSLHIFLSEGVDVSIMEVGIGGQYDSTNFIRKPVVCGMTSLGFDHVSILGNTIEQIAWNKAGIFKSGSPAIVVNQPPSAMQVILDRAKERQSALYLSEPIDKDVLEKEGINLGISGKKQADNAGLAVQLSRVWEERQKAMREPVLCNVTAVMNTDGIQVLETTHIDNITAKGLSSCVWPGRAQIIKRPGTSVTYYLDGAHTRESIEVCSQWFKEKADTEKESVKGKVVRVLIFNITGERKAGPLLECLKECDFDAAGFCTNTVSTVDSFNKKDQINPMYTSKVMIQKTEENKMCWDQLQLHNQGDHRLLTNPTDVSSASQQDVGANSLRSTADADTDATLDGVVVKKRILDTTVLSTSSSTIAPSSLSSSSASLSNTKVNGTANSDRNHLLTSADCQNDTEVDKDNRNGTVITTFPNNDYAEKNYNNNNNTCKVPSDSSCHCDNVKDERPTGKADDSKSAPQRDSYDPGSRVGKSNGSDTGDLSPSSQSFPCVLQALAWATQGNDQTVMVRDASISLPPTPRDLQDADHVQVLVTGSLLLVGGVLGVIDPHMND